MVGVAASIMTDTGHLGRFVDIAGDMGEEQWLIQRLLGKLSESLWGAQNLLLCLQWGVKYGLAWGSGW